jgi:phospholipase C
MTPFSPKSQSQLQTTEHDLPIPAESGIDHVVLVLMENRSFDHFLGWLPGAHERQAGLAVTNSPNWPGTLLVINFDEWGGFFDHVPPPTAPIPIADRLAGNQDGRLGFRTPALLSSPWSRRGHVSHIQFDHTSVLKLIEWRWGLSPLTIRDETANNLALALSFEEPNIEAPQYAVPARPFGGVCPQAVASTEESEWAALRAMAAGLGFPFP